MPVTLFCSCKPFTGHDAVIQHNALRNWRSLGLRVILCGDDPGSAEAAALYGCTHIPDVACSEYGTPLLSDMFAKSQAAATTPFVGYINGDILLPPDFAEKTRMAASRFTAFLMVGERWNVDIAAPLPDPGEDMAALLRAYGGERQAPTALDYFVFPRGMAAYMPDLHVGRPCWDNWFLWETKRRGIAVVDASAVLTVLHQNHGYRHVPGGDGRGWDGPEAALNRTILKAYPGFNPLRGTILHATHRLTPSGIRSGSLFRRLAWDARWTALRAYGKLRAILRETA